MDYPTNTITMAVLFDATVACLWQIPTPGGLFARCWPRAVWKCFVKFIDLAAKKNIIGLKNCILLFYCYWLLLPPKWWNHPPCVLAPRRSSDPSSPSPHSPIFGWFMSEKIIPWWVPKATVYFLFFLYAIPCVPQNNGTMPPTPTPSTPVMPHISSPVPQTPTLGWLLCRIV